MGKRKTQAVINPVNVLKQALELDRYVSKLDVHRMDKQGLTDYILSILPDSSIQQLKTFNEPDTIREVILILLQTTDLLNSNQAKIIATQLTRLSDDDEEKKYIGNALQQQRKKENLDKFQPYMIALAAVMICMLIWLLSR